jgi:predicted O-linked N-acetylglucosamine transferase (SPINDLY family)
MALERYLDAVDALHHAAALIPHDGRLQLLLGNACYRNRDLSGAMKHYQAAIELCPDDAAALNNYGYCLTSQNRFEEAAQIYQKALAIRPDYVNAHMNLAGAFKLSFRCIGALTHYLRALEIAPQDASAHQGVASMLSALSDYGDVLRYSDAALNLKPDDADIWENRLYILSYHPDLSAGEIYREFERWGGRYAEPEVDYSRHDRTVGKRLRVGYVSPDFRKHTSRFYFEPLFAHHDKSQVELYAYSNVGKEDEHTGRFKAIFDHWRDIRGLNAEQAAAQIKADGIDILVDACNHMADHRLDIFTLKPAPIQVTWLGAAWTTGLKAVDYVLFDPYLAPEGTLAREQIVRLPHCFVAYRPPEETAEIGGLPAVKNGHITFGYSGRTERLNHKTFRVWGEILKRLPEARLILDFPPFADVPTQAYYRQFLAGHGVDVSRVEMRHSKNIFVGLNDIDILLDCFPHSGGTMLFDALWMGVPVLTLASRPPVGRIGTSLMMNLGLSEWVAQSEEEYVEKAVRHAQDLDKLSALRAGMRERMRGSPLMDEAGFARGVEATYREMWQKFCSGAIGEL